MTTHDLKVWPTYFDAIADGSKSFELRRDDRGFRAGDRLRLREWNPNSEAYTGREATCSVEYLLAGTPELGLLRGFVIMAIRLVGARL
jgi:hypothetical protein